MGFSTDNIAVLTKLFYLSMQSPAAALTSSKSREDSMVMTIRKPTLRDPSKCREGIIFTVFVYVCMYVSD